MEGRIMAFATWKKITAVLNAVKTESHYFFEEIANMLCKLHIQIHAFLTRSVYESNFVNNVACIACTFYSGQLLT